MFSFQSNLVLRTGAMAGLAVVLASSALAQQGTIKASKRMIGPRAVKESTLSVFPQIDERIHLRGVRPEHEVPDTWRKPDTGPNSLPVGGLLSQPRANVTAKFPGIGFNGSWPADTNFAVGPGHIVQVVNTSIAFYTKSGNKIFQQTINGGGGFWGSVGAGGFIFDPKAFYDPISNRYFVVALDLNEGSSISKILVAVSDDSNPTGSWFKYRIEAKQTINGVASWLDYPGWAANKDAVVCTGNMFGFGAGFQGGSLIVMSKAQLLTGGAPTITYFVDQNYTIQPTRTVDATADKIYAISEQNNTSLKLYALTNLTSTPALTFRSLTVPTYATPPGVVPSQGGTFLDSLRFIVMNAWQRGGKVVCAHTVGKTQGSSEAMIRWYEINMNGWPTTTGTPAVAQSGNVSPAAGQSNIQPAVTMNGVGDISVIYTRASSSIIADIMIAGRKQSDPPGTMGAPQLVQNSTTVWNRQRWGDYSDIAVDPLDDTRFWGTNMTAEGGQWGSTIQTWLISQPGGGGGGGTAVEPTSITMFQGAGSSGDVNSVKLSDDLYFDVTSMPETGLGQIAAAELSFTLPAGTVDQLRGKFEMVGVTGTTGMVWLYNWTTNKYENIKAFSVKGSGNTVNTVPIATPATYVSPGREVKMVVRGLLPQRRGSMPPSFKFRSDQILLILN